MLLKRIMNQIKKMAIKKQNQKSSLNFKKKRERRDRQKKASFSSGLGGFLGTVEKTLIYFADV